MAHELQHVLEIAAHPEVIDGRSMADLYRRIGRTSRAAAMEAYETEAAKEVGAAVRQEVSRFADASRSSK